MTKPYLIEQNGLLQDLYDDPSCGLMINLEDPLEAHARDEALNFIKKCLHGFVRNYGPKRTFDDWTEAAQKRKQEDYLEVLKPLKPRYIAHAVAYVLNGKHDDKGYPPIPSELKKLADRLIPSSDSTRSDFRRVEDTPHLLLGDLAKSRKTLASQRHMTALKIKLGKLEPNEWVKKGHEKTKKELENYYRFVTGRLTDAHFDVVDYLRSIWDKPEDKGFLQEHLNFFLPSQTKA